MSFKTGAEHQVPSDIENHDFKSRQLDRGLSSFPASNLDGVVQGKHKNLSIAEVAIVAGFGNRLDGFYRPFEKVVVNSNLEHDLA